MSSKVRALVWEELRVGGPLVGEFLVIGVLMLVYIQNGLGVYNHGVWGEMSGYCLTVVLGAPLVCSLLLVLNIRNSGHLGGGLSRRILRMPVDTLAAVTAPMLVRLAGVLLLAGALALACRLMFGDGPGGRSVVILASVYLLIQVLDWARGVVSAALPALLALAALVLLQLVLPWQHWMTVAGAQAPLTLLSVLAFAGVAGGAYGASLLLGAWSRRGARVELPAVPALPEFAVRRRVADRPPFSSPWVARFWLEFRQTGLFLPKMAVLFYTMGAALRWLMAWFSLDKGGGVRSTVQEYWWDGLWLAVFLPLIALLAAACAWRFRVFWVGRRAGRQTSGWIAPSVLPDAQLAKARLAVAAVNLAVALALVTAIYAAYFLSSNYGELGSLLGDAWAQGETNLREIGAMVLGVPLFIGLLAWFIMYMPLPVLSVFVLLPVLHFGVGQSLRGLRGTAFYPSRGTWDFLNRLDNVLITATVVFPTVYLLACLATLAWLGRISWRSVAVCVGGWLLLALALFPFSAHPEAPLRGAAVLCCLSLAALGAVCWPQAVLALGRAGLRLPLTGENPEQHGRVRSMARGGRSAVKLAALAVVLCGVASVRWPAESAAAKVLRAQGLPTSMKELEQWYPPVPAGENLAVPLVAIANRAYRKTHAGWNGGLPLGMGAEVERTELVPAETWETTKQQWDGAWRDIAASTHAALHSGLTKCRYAMRFNGYQDYTESSLTADALVPALRMEMWVALVERRPEEASSAILDTLALADTLADDPLCRSQQQRFYFLARATGLSNTLLNRIELPEDSLRRLQEAYGRARATAFSDAFKKRAAAVQRVAVFLADYEGALRRHFGGYVYLFGKELPMGDLLIQAMAWTVVDALGTGTLSRVANVYNGWHGPEERRRVREAQGSQAPVPRRRPLINILVPSFWGGGDFYDQHGLDRAQGAANLALDLAIAGIAVDRFRLANGRLPERLEELVPAFLDRVPEDPWNGGKPLSYRAQENGEYVVYSFGQNRKDDSGTDLETKRGWRQNVDVTFTVAPPEVRRRPQVADATAAGV